MYMYYMYIYIGMLKDRLDSLLSSSSVNLCRYFEAEGGDISLQRLEKQKKHKSLDPL